jgi:hypothetical protein
MSMADAMGCAMDGLQNFDFALFAAGTFAAAFVTGLVGFAFGVATFVMIALWLGNTGMIGDETAWLFLARRPRGPPNGYAAE